MPARKSVRLSGRKLKRKLKRQKVRQTKHLNKRKWQQQHAASLKSVASRVDIGGMMDEKADSTVDIETTTLSQIEDITTSVKRKKSSLILHMRSAFVFN